jgi:hypothetical protein
MINSAGGCRWQPHLPWVQKKGNGFFFSAARRFLFFGVAVSRGAHLGLLLGVRKDFLLAKKKATRTNVEQKKQTNYKKNYYLLLLLIIIL